MQLVSTSPENSSTAVASSYHKVHFSTNKEYVITKIKYIYFAKEITIFEAMLKILVMSKGTLPVSPYIITLGVVLLYPSTYLQNLR